MKIVILFVLLSVHLICASKEWNSFKTTHQKVYKNSKEESYRKQIFLKNLQRIEEHNRKYEQGVSTFSVKVHKFSDYTHEELYPSSESRTNLVASGVQAPTKSKFVPSAEVPDSIDWRDYGVVTPISNQEFCNSCWAFAVVGTVEAHMGIYHGINVSLSQQNLVDCVDPTFNCGLSLDRHMLEKTYQYIIDNGGIDTLSSYPYESYIVADCRFVSDAVGATVSAYANITEADEEELKAVVGTIGPVSVAFTTDYLWDGYSHGVYNNPNCMTDAPEIFNHAVVIVGYGTEDGTDYWLVKNSWGTWFGEEGYIKMARNQDNQCGIASIARYPIM